MISRVLCPRVGTLPSLVPSDTAPLSGKAVIVLAIWVETSEKYKKL